MITSLSLPQNTTESPHLLMDPRLRKQLFIWLMLVAVCVFGMIVLGGVTRLTESGLSIVEWKPISGTFPPMNAADWEAELENYRSSPQYQKINKGMSIEEFKGIFWLEYLHRLAGRVLGFVFLIPLLYFTLKHTLPRWLKWRLVGLFVLGGLQGLLGWYMVKSGLVDEPMVSQYRLAAHLGLAFLLMGALLWTALEVAQPAINKLEKASTYTKSSYLITALVFVQVVLGALVAGLDAGLIYNTFPTMDGAWIPNDLYFLEPWWINHTENITMVQFQHRIGAYVLTAMIGFFAFMLWRDAIKSRIRIQAMLLMGVLTLQFGLGVFTLLLQVPIMLASKHQAVAAILFALCIWTSYDLRCEDSRQQ